MSKAKDILDIIEGAAEKLQPIQQPKKEPKPVDEYEHHFTHGGRKAVAMFHVMDLGHKGSGRTPGPYSNDPYGHHGTAPSMKLHGAWYADGEQEEIHNLSPEHKSKLSDEAADAYSDLQDNN